MITCSVCYFVYSGIIWDVKPELSQSRKRLVKEKLKVAVV